MFNEDASWNFNSGNESSNIQLMPTNDVVDQEHVADPSSSYPSIVSSMEPSTSPTLEEPSAEPIPLRRSTRDRKPNPKYVDSTSCTFALLVSDPICFEDAEKEDKWCKAMEEELLAIQENQTWDLVNFPEGKKAIGLKWVFN